MILVLVCVFRCLAPGRHKFALRSGYSGAGRGEDEASPAGCVRGPRYCQGRTVMRKPASAMRTAISAMNTRSFWSFTCRSAAAADRSAGVRPVCTSAADGRDDTGESTPALPSFLTCFCSALIAFFCLLLSSLASPTAGSSNARTQDKRKVHPGDRHVESHHGPRSRPDHVRHAIRNGRHKAAVRDWSWR